MSKDKKGLGRGFDSLIPTDVIEPEFDVTSSIDNSKIRQVSPDKIDPNPHQPRQEFKEDQLKELQSSIKTHGILQPLVVTPQGKRYELIAGERRLRAAKSLGLKEVPVIVRSFKEQDKLELAIIENVQREDLNAIELATSYQKLMNQFNQSYDEIAKQVGKNVSTVKNIVRLLKLPMEAKRALTDGDITEGHARAILSVKDHDKQLELLEMIKSKSWTVAQAENFAKHFKKEGTQKKSALKKSKKESPVTKKLSKLLDTKVELQHRAKGGRLVIRYKNEEDLERIVSKINKT